MSGSSVPGRRGSSVPGRRGGGGLAGTSALVLAGGLGTRLRPVVADRPKVLADVAGRPFLALLLDRLADAGLRHVVLCTGYRGQDVRDAFGSAYGPLRLEYSHEAEPLGTAGALRRALPLLASEAALVLNGDTICEADLGAFCAWSEARAVDGALLLVRVADTTRYGRVVVDRQGVIQAFAEKAAEGGPGWVNAGVYRLSRRLLANLPADRPLSLEREVLPARVGRRLLGYRSRGHFLDIGTPESYRAARTVYSRSAA